MAFGILCEHCGWQQTDHIAGVGPDDGDVAEGRRCSLADCPGYHPENEAEHNRLTDQAAEEEFVQLKRGFWPQ